MSRNYDNWEKLVEAVLRREKDRQLALFESFSSSVFSSRPSFDSGVSAAAPSSRRNFVSHIQFEEIKLSAQNFQPDMLLGKGRFGPVFKGWIHEHFLTAVKPGSGIAVAIRKLKKGGMVNFNQPRHPNLVKLIGYSFDECNRVLVYEFMPNGSLDNHLFIRGHQPLSWETRVKVAIGAARGLSLFHDLKILVTHEGVKTSSILLDDECNASWSDFDLIVLPILNETPYRVSNDYAAPENIATGRLTVKSDVYSFGIILLELLCGLRVFDQNRPMKEQNLVVWVKPYLRKERKLLQIVDSRLGDLYPHDEAYKFGKLALKCLTLDPKLRPSMTEVVAILEQFGAHYHQNRTEHTTDPSSQSILLLQEVMALQFDVIKKATRNFQPDLLLGEGRSGSVYKGIIHEHPLTSVKLEPEIVVAVKNLSSKQVAGTREWLVKMNHLSKIPGHPNLVELIGHCLEGNNKILVYEFVRGGGLDRHLFTRGGQSLHWEIRLKVAIGIARALVFLRFSGIGIPYRDFNSGDILLDDEFNAKLSDYWLREHADIGSLKIGYEPPEYLTTGHIHAKSVVYSFGVVLLELLTGRRAYDRDQPMKLVEFAKSYLGNQTKVLRIVDSRLEGRFPCEQVYKVAEIASQCVSPVPRDRPAMSEVVAALEQTMQKITPDSSSSSKDTSPKGNRKIMFADEAGGELCHVRFFHDSIASPASDAVEQ